MENDGHVLFEILHDLSNEQGFSPYSVVLMVGLQVLQWLSIV